MNYFVVVPALLHVLEEMPALVNDVRDFWERLTAAMPPPPVHAAAMDAALADGVTPSS